MQAGEPGPPRDGVGALTERERETLRLLLGGHDAKSSAKALGLSVHTVNERLRDARRKLGVSSSREAARLLAQAERGGPQLLGDKGLGVSDDGGEALGGTRRVDRRLAWFAGGLIMLLVIASVLLPLLPDGDGAVVGETVVAAPAPSDARQAAGLAAARAWTALLDRGQWEDSWRTAAAWFKTQVPESQWVATIRSIKGPLGPASARVLQSATTTGSLPGAPAGDYQVLLFRTRFAGKADAVETVTLTREGNAWKVSGYFIR